MARMRICLLVVVLALCCHGKGDMGDFSPEEAGISPERIAQFYTEMMVQGAGREQQQCSQSVLQVELKNS